MLGKQTMLSDSAHKDMVIAHIQRQVKLHADEQEFIKAVFRQKYFAKGQFLLQEGDVCRHETYVISGSLHAYAVDRDSRMHSLHFAIDDWWMSDLESLLNRSPSTRFIRALTACVVLQITHDDLETLYERIPAMDRFFRILHQRAAIAQDRRILNNISLSGEERYDWFVRKYPLFVQQIPQKYIASYLGITPEFLSAIRSKRAKRA